MDEPKGTPGSAETYTLDLETITLGELADLEEETGQSSTALIARGSATRRLVAAWIASRRSGTPRSWAELRGLRLLDASSSTLRSGPAGIPDPVSD